MLGPVSALALALAPADDRPVSTAPSAKAAKASPALSFEPKTKVDGDTLQVIVGQRALFRLDDRGLPVLGKVEEGKLAAAHPTGAVKETFAPPPKGQLAAALDGSAEKRASVLKVWNGMSRPMDFRVMGLVLRQDKLTPIVLKACAVPPGASRTETWPAPIVAVGLARFTPATGAAKDCK